MNENDAWELLGDQTWRLNNLYKIKDKQGAIVDFTLNWAQNLLKEPHYLNIILKARACALSRKRGGTSHKLTTWHYYLPCNTILGHLFIQ